MMYNWLQPHVIRDGLYFPNASWTKATRRAPIKMEDQVMRWLNQGKIQSRLFNHFYFPHPIVTDFVAAAGPAWSRSALHRPQCLPCLWHTCRRDWHTYKYKQIAGARTENTRTPTQKEGPCCEKKSYSTPYINSGLDKHNTHKRVTPWK